MALAVWLARGLPRPPATTAVAAIVPVGLLTALPLGALLNISALSDTFTLVPLLRLTQLLDGGLESVEVLLALGSIVAATAFAVLPRRLAPAIPVGIAVFFLLTTYSAFGCDQGLLAEPVRGRRRRPRKLDRRAHRRQGEAVYLFGTNPDPGQEGSILWQAELWNEELGTVYHLDGAVEPLPGAAASIDRATGRIVAQPGQPDPAGGAVRGRVGRDRRSTGGSSRGTARWRSTA